MNLSEIRWPVFLLKTDKPTIVGGISYYLYENHSEDEEGEILTRRKVLVVDSTEEIGDSLALRRLQLKAQGVPLYNLRKALFFLGDLIKLAKPTQWFIDSAGKMFTYTKERRASLRSYPITNVFNIDSGGAIIEIDYAQRFKVLHRPDPKLRYAGILTIKMEKILYGLYEEPFKETWRMI